MSTVAMQDEIRKLSIYSDGGATLRAYVMIYG